MRFVPGSSGRFNIHKVSERRSSMSPQLTKDQAIEKMLGFLRQAHANPDEIIRALAQVLAQTQEASNTPGVSACWWTDSQGNRVCQNLTEDQCRGIHGATWDPKNKCPVPTPP